MDAIEVKPAGIHSNIGFIAEEHPPDLDLDKTADKEKVDANSNALLAGGVDVDGAVDAAGDDNYTSALLEEIAQTIHASEEAAGGKDSSGGNINFGLELEDDDDGDLYVPKLDLGDMPDESDIPEEDKDVDDTDGDGDLGIKGDGEAHGSLKGDIDLDIGESGETDLSPKGVELSVPLTNRVDGDGGDTKVVPLGGEVRPDDVGVKAPSGSVKVNLDSDQPGTEQIDDISKAKAPSTNVDMI
ncbi:uncharacterized protein [Amphiura filiformis]|uniref:uncharacterized protein n=1 Tax=Amphiura filiformis TaxID=82378 RepID=UPI003B219476